MFKLCTKFERNRTISGLVTDDMFLRFEIRAAEVQGQGVKGSKVTVKASRGNVTRSRRANAESVQDRDTAEDGRNLFRSRGVHNTGIPMSPVGITWEWESLG